MNLTTQIEKRLFDYLPPDKQVGVEQHFAKLEADNEDEDGTPGERLARDAYCEKPNNCPNCGTPIAEADSFCDYDCKDALWGIDKAQIEREKTAGQREDAEEHRRELAREDFERRMEQMREMKGE